MQPRRRRTQPQVQEPQAQATQVFSLKNTAKAFERPLASGDPVLSSVPSEVLMDDDETNAMPIAHFGEMARDVQSEWQPNPSFEPATVAFQPDVSPQQKPKNQMLSWLKKQHQEASQKFTMSFSPLKEMEQAEEQEENPSFPSYRAEYTQTFSQSNPTLDSKASTPHYPPPPSNQGEVYFLNQNQHQEDLKQSFTKDILLKQEQMAHSAQNITDNEQSLKNENIKLSYFFINVVGSIVGLAVLFVLIAALLSFYNWFKIDLQNIIRYVLD